MYKFMADHMVKRACEWLRLMGYDISYPESHDDTDILAECKSKNLILLTRDIEFYKRYNRSIYMDSTDFRQQVREIVSMFPPDKHNFFTRCPVCNNPLDEISTANMDSNKFSLVKKRFKVINYCPVCKKFYWKGTHYSKILKEINSLIKNNTGNM